MCWTVTAHYYSVAHSTTNLPVQAAIYYELLRSGESLISKVDAMHLLDVLL